MNIVRLSIHRWKLNCCNRKSLQFNEVPQLLAVSSDAAFINEQQGKQKVNYCTLQLSSFIVFLQFFTRHQFIMVLSDIVFL